MSGPGIVTAIPDMKFFRINRPTLAEKWLLRPIKNGSVGHLTFHRPAKPGKVDLSLVYSAIMRLVTGLALVHVDCQEQKWDQLLSTI